MKVLNKIFAAILSFALLVSGISVMAADSVAMTYDEIGYVTVSGNAGEGHVGFDATLMLVKADVTDYDNMKESDIGYIGQTTIDADGSYSFEFGFSDFEYNANTVSNYKALVNVDGTQVTPSVTKVERISDMASFDIDFSNFGRSVANITNQYKLKDLGYKMVICFYSENGKLLDVIMENKYTGDSNKITYSYSDVPYGTSYAKAFIWESLGSLIPLTTPEKLDISGRTASREVMMLTIAPGSDETERNFAWYDIPEIDGAQIQYAVKTSENDLSVFPEDRAVTVQGTSERVDVDDYIGIKFGELEFSHDEEYTSCKATITGLQKGTEYVYRLGDKFGWCKGIYEFKTDAAPENGFDFLLFSDEHAHYNVDGRSNYIIDEARTKALETVPNASLAIAVGDLVDYPWFEIAYEKYFDRDAMTSLPLAAVSGSTHDFMIKYPSATLFDYHFNMPNPDNVSYIKNLGANYYYTYGDVLFINIMHNLPVNYEQTKAYIEKVANAHPDVKWKVLVAHIPFGVDTEGENITFANYFKEENADFIADCGVDVVISGHTHAYARTNPLYAGKVTNDVVTDDSVTNPKGVTYINLNTSGMLSGGYNHNYPEYVAKGDNVPLNPYSRNDSYPYGDYYYTNFSKAEVITESGSTTLKITTYRNSHSLSAPYPVVKTDIIDTYTITKTK